MTLYEWLKFGHVLGAAVWVGAGIYGTAIFMSMKSAGRSEMLAANRAFAGGERVFIIASVLTIVFGVWMVLDQPAISFGDTWVLIGIGGILVSGAWNGIVIQPRWKKANEALETDEPGAVESVRALLKLAYLDPLILIVVVWAMVTKPGL